MTENNDTSKKVSAKMCKETYKAALSCMPYLSSNYPTTSISYIRSLFETVECDQIHDLSSFRKDFQDKLNATDEKRTARILNFHEKDSDRDAAVHLVTHYQNWHKSNLKDAIHSARISQCQEIIEQGKSVVDWVQDKYQKKN